MSDAPKNHLAACDDDAVLVSPIEDFIFRCNEIGRSRELSLAITNAQQALMWARQHGKG